jgi:prepilin-type N-terminal cleavage/methylation domain-containing protein/prepilin-type processing-associated H-X9-DG protein
MSSRRQRLGFTLIELLVVIAIIAILAAILFPVFAQARAKARQAACLSNSKQLGLALYMYAQDYDETLPPETFNYDDDNQTVYALVQPYTKNLEIWTCPSMRTVLSEAQVPTNGVVNDRAWWIWAAGQWKPGSIGMNLSVFPWGDGKTMNAGPGNAGRTCALATVSRPADTICFFDSRWVGARGIDAIAIDIGIPASKRHCNTANFVFADGHARAISAQPYPAGLTGLSSTESLAAKNGALNFRMLLDTTKYVWDPATTP